MIQKLKPKQSLFMKSEFSRNVLTLMTGTTIAQAIPIAMSPILTRIYTPEDFGVFALFTAITAIFGSIANGRYELAIMLPKKDEDAINILALGLIITVFISSVLFILVLVFNDYFTSLLGNDEISIWLYFVPIAVFLTGLLNLLNYFNNRKKNYKDLAKATILRAFAGAVVQLSIGFLKQGATGLISGQLVSQLVANTKLLKNIIKDKLLLTKINKIKIIALSKRYKKFPKFSMPSAIMNTASLQMPVLLLGTFFTPATVGFFSLSHRFISMPMSIIGGSIGQVFFQQSANVKNDKEALKKLTLNTYKKLFKLGIIPFSIITAFGDVIFAFVFGQEWIVAGEYAQVLAIWILFLFVHSPITSLFSTLEKQKEAMIINIVIILSRVMVIFFTALLYSDAYITIVSYSILGIVLNLYILFYFFKLLDISILSEIKYLTGNILLVITPLLVIRTVLI